jgi:hypothetical protein
VTSHRATINYAESWVVPAATGAYVVRNGGARAAVLLKVFVKSTRVASDCDDVAMAKLSQQ